jgi:hypothetical protein
MTIHKNTMDAYLALKVSDREREALDALHMLGGRATDREIARAMGSADPNRARPRITALIDRGILREVDTVKCAETGRNVRVVQRCA